MTQTVALRSRKDRLRYTISFEICLMAILIPAGAAFFDKSLLDIGLLGLILSTKAMIVNYGYNIVFDRIDARFGRTASDRGVVARILHAAGFEGTLLITSLPIYIFWLGLTIWQAIAADLVVTSFVMVFTFFFTLGFDKLYPVTPAQEAS